MSRRYLMIAVASASGELATPARHRRIQVFIVAVFTGEDGPLYHIDVILVGISERRTTYIG